MEEAVTYFNVQKLPIEMWNEIFQYTNFNDLKNLSLVCRYFYQMIGSSPDIMDKFILKISNEKKSPDFQTISSSSRNYRKLMIHNVDNLETISEILEKFAGNLTYLKVVDCKLSDIEMLKLLELTSSNLKTLHLERLPKKATTEEPVKFSFKFQQLETLLFLNCDFFALLDCFPDTLRSFSFYSFTIDHDFEMENIDVKNFSSFSNFLTRQTALKELKMYFFIDGIFEQVIFFNAFEEKMKFRLESLEVTSIASLDPDAFLHANSNFEEFLKSQSPNLKTLKLKRTLIDPQAVDVDFPLLKKFTFNKLECDDERFCYSNYNKLFPNLTEIAVEMDFGDWTDTGNPQLFIKLGENYPNLKKLKIKTIEDHWFEYASFDSIEELTITSFKGKENLDNMFLAFKNLKALNIMKYNSIHSKFLAWILLNFKFLERLVIRNGSKFKNVHLVNMSQLFQNLKHLEIFNIQEPVDQFKEILDRQFPDLKYRLSQEEATKIYDDEKEEKFAFQEIFCEDSEDENESEDYSESEDESDSDSTDFESEEDNEIEGESNSENEDKEDSKVEEDSDTEENAGECKNDTESNDHCQIEENRDVEDKKDWENKEASETESKDDTENKDFYDGWVDNADGWVDCNADGWDDCDHWE